MHTAIWGHLAANVQREGSPAAIIARCKDVGINKYMAYVLPMESGTSFGESDFFAYNTTAFQGKKNDLLTPLAKAGKSEGIEVEPWLLPFRPHLLKGETEAEVLSRTYQPIGYKDKDDVAGYATAGKRLCPTWPENRVRAILMLKDYIENHGADLSGIDMDYIRYGDAVTCREAPCHCAACRKEYQALIGKDTLSAEDLKEAGVMYRFVQFRSRCIRELVEEIRDLTNQAGLRLTMSARVQFFDYALIEGQDWPQWASDGLIDAIYLMNYALERDLHRQRTQLAVNVLKEKGDCLLCDGVGKMSSLGENPTENMITYIKDALALGVDGFSIFHYNGMKDDDFAAVKALLT